MMRGILFGITTFARQLRLQNYQNFISLQSPVKADLLCPVTIQLSRNFTTTNVSAAAKGKKDAALIGTTVKARFPVEEDPEKLVNYVCGTDFLKEGLEPVKIKPDSEYPDWLWTVRLEKAPPLEELDPNSKAYWKRTKAYLRKYKKELRKLRKF